MFKKIIATFLSLSLLIGIQTCKVNAEETTDEPVIVTVEQMEYEMGPNSPFAGKYVTYGIDEQGNIIRLSVSEYQERSGGYIVEKIIVWIGQQIVGYLISSVVDGVVVSVTGHSGGEWAAIAIRQVLNKKYSSNVYIPTDTVCAGYPMYGWKPDYCR